LLLFAPVTGDVVPVFVMGRVATLVERILLVTTLLVSVPPLAFVIEVVFVENLFVPVMFVRPLVGMPTTLLLLILIPPCGVPFVPPMKSEPSAAP